MAQEIIDLLNAGVNANHDDKFRRGNLIALPATGSLIVTGDLHGHRRNFERIVNYTDLENNPERHIILQEVIHGGPQDEFGGCLSYEVLFDLVRYKVKFPHQVHIIMGNHDTAFINNSKVLKGDQEMNHSMRSALKRKFNDNTPDIEAAISQFLFSEPLAARCENRIWMSHSLPADNYIDQFDENIFHKKLKVNEIVRPGSAYLLSWGRRHSQKTIDKLAKLFDVDLFILGHQPQERGYSNPKKNVIIIASEHNHGCLVNLDLGKEYTTDSIIESIVPLASIE